MQTCQAYQSCPVCTHAWSAPLRIRGGCVTDGYRRFLDIGDEGRQQKVTYKGQTYEYKDECRQPRPKMRDTEFVRSVCSVASEKKPFLGHKFPPIICRWPEFDWERIFTSPELMHGMS